MVLVLHSQPMLEIPKPQLPERPPDPLKVMLLQPPHWVFWKLDPLFEHLPLWWHSWPLPWSHSMTKSTSKSEIRSKVAAVKSRSEQLILGWFLRSASTHWLPPKVREARVRLDFPPPRPWKSLLQVHPDPGTPAPAPTPNEKPSKPLKPPRGMPPKPHPPCCSGEHLVGVVPGHL